VQRFLSVDPLAAKYAAISPYAYVANNPIIFIDPDGRRIIWGEDEASKALKKKVMVLHQSSKIFRSIYNYLDKLEYEINVYADDASVQAEYQRQTK
jgi:hypothetical protein